MMGCPHPTPGGQCGKPVPPNRRGRPARFCLEHRAPKFAKERERSGWTAAHKLDHLAGRDCCLLNGRECEQHGQMRQRTWWRRIKPRRDVYEMKDDGQWGLREGFADDAATYQDMLTTLGHYTVYSARGHHLYSKDRPVSTDPWEAT